MANAYSLLNNFDAPLYSPNFLAISKALTYKQNKLETNRAELDQMYDNVTDLDLLKDQDKDYADKRIAAVTKLVNQYAGQDLSNDGLAKSLQTDLSQILDDNVKNAVYSSALYRAEEKKWDAMKDKNPEKYSDQNYWYSHKGFNNYMNDGKVGSKYKGGSGVIEYQDVASKINENLPKMLKDKGVNVQINEFGKYYWDKTKTRDISEAEVMSAINATIDDKDRQQLQINANYGFRTHSDEDMFKMYENQRDLKLEGVNSEINRLNKALSTSIPGSQAKRYKEAKNQLEGYKDSLTTSDPPSRSTIENALYTEEFFAPFKETYSVHEVTDRSLIKDELSFKELDFEMDLTKMSIRQENAEELITLKAIAKAQAKKDKKKAGSPLSKLPYGGEVIDGVAMPENSLQSETPLDVFEVQAHYSELQNKTDGILKELTEEGVLPDMYSNTPDQVEALNKLTNFNGVPIGASTEMDASGQPKLVYSTGYKEGQMETLTLTADQAAKMMEVSTSIQMLTDADWNMTNALDQGVNKFQESLIKAGNVALENLVGFNFRADTKNGKTLVPITEDRFKYSNLVKKAQTGGKMDSDELETLKLYVGLDVMGGFAMKEDNSKNSVLVNATETWLRKKSLEFTNGGKFISTNPNDYNIYANTPTDIVSQYAVDDTKKSELFSESNREKAYDRIMDEFYAGNNMVVENSHTSNMQDNKYQGVFPPRVDINIDKLIDNMLASGKEVSNYNFSDKESELVYKANTAGVGRTFYKSWGSANDATVADLDRGDLEYNDPEWSFWSDRDADVHSFDKFYETMKGTVQGYSDDLGEKSKKAQQNSFTYTKKTAAGKLIMDQIEDHFILNSREIIGFGDKIYTSFNQNGDMQIYGDIFVEGDEVEARGPGEPMIIKKDKIPDAVPKEDTRKVTSFNANDRRPNSRYIFLETKKHTPAIVDYILAHEEEGTTTGRPMFEEFVTKTAFDGMSFHLKAENGTYVNKLVMRTPGGPTTILLSDTGLVEIQEEGEGSVEEMMKVGASYDTLLALYGDEIVSGIYNAYNAYVDKLVSQ